MTKTWANRPSAARSGTASNAFSPTWAPAKWACCWSPTFPSGAQLRRLVPTARPGRPQPRPGQRQRRRLRPRAYDDRLLLGVKGAFSEAQWHLMRAQMQAARLNKAKRGELALRLPIGYQRLPNGQVILTADEQVQTSIRQVFHLFRRLGSAHAVLGHLQQTGLRLPRQSRNLVGQTIILWDRASYSQVYQILKLPAYAGVYAYGQRRREGLPGAPGTRYGGRLPRPNGKSCSGMPFRLYYLAGIYGKPGETGAKLAGHPFADPPTPRSMAVRGHNPLRQRRGGEGRALLTGIVICARCGRPMRVRYRDKPAYVCEATKSQFNEPRCQFSPTPM
ncbi:MAG: recombinase zinc beta ribbon domain-containing protein [Ardenticatenaceae bacterium]|nr:recombinase zinc beta ribbon domain-containing protein [Ardenticatenaceae bacterium]